MAEIFGNTTATPIKPDLFRNEVDNTFDSKSENAQSGKAVAEAISNAVIGEAGIVVDQEYSTKSSNAQSGKAVSGAVLQVYDLMTTEEQQGVNLLDPDTFIEGYIDNTGTTRTSSTLSYTSVPLEVTECDVLRVYTRGQVSYDKTSKIRAVAAFVNGVIEPTLGVNENVLSYTVPVGVTSVIITSSSSTQLLTKNMDTPPTEKVDYVAPVKIPNKDFFASYEEAKNTANKNLAELLNAREGFDGIVYETVGEAIREQAKQVKKSANVPVTSDTVNPLVVEMIADFNWTCNTEVSAFNGSGAYIDEISNTANNAFFCVSGVAGNDYVTVIEGGNATTTDISTITSNKPFGAVLKYDDGTYEVCNAWYRDNSTISIYPKLKSDITTGELGNLKTGIHLSRRGYEAYAQKIYNTNPKWCEKSNLIIGYRPTQNATIEDTPFNLYGATGVTVHKLLTDRGLDAKTFLYKLLPTAYHFYGANVETDIESGIEWTVDLDNKKGYMELYVGGCNYNSYETETDNPIYIDLYLDGVLYKQVVKTTNILERICIDFEKALTAQLKIYMKKYNSPSFGFTLSAISFWENKMNFTDTNYLVPKFSTIGQMFDSWGEFHDSQSAKSLKALHNARCGISVPYENHSKGSQTTVWGKAWFYENVLKYHPSHMLIDFFINDFNSEGGGLSEATILGPDNTEYVNVVSVDEYIQNVKDLMNMAIVNGIQPIFIGNALHNAYSFEGVDTEPRSMNVWYMKLVDEMRNLN